MARPNYIKESAVEESEKETPVNYRGFCGKAVKIKIYGSDGVHDHANPWVELALGDLPTVTVLRGFNWIIPVEALSVLQDTSVETVEHRALRRPDENGNVWKEVPKVVNRFQFQVLGEVPWEEYEAFRTKIRNGELPAT